MTDSNEQYILQAKELLKMISGTGQEAYIVGEALRNLIIDRKITETEIFTGLNKVNLLRLFASDDIIERSKDYVIVDYFGFRFRISFSAAITFPQAEIGYYRRHYSSSLMNFLGSKLYSVNTLAMGPNNVICDCFNGRADLARKRIRLICENPLTVFEADPKQMLTAVSLISELGFRPDRNIYTAVKKRNRCLSSLPISVMGKEIIKIIEGENAGKAISFLVKTKLIKRTGPFRIDLTRLNDHYRPEDGDLFLGIVMTRLNAYNEEIGALGKNRLQLKKTVDLALTHPKSVFGPDILYNYGIEACLRANRINWVLGRSHRKEKQIKRNYERLPIKSPRDLVFGEEDIYKINKNVPIGELKKILGEVAGMIIGGALVNDYRAISEFVEKRTATFRTCSEDGAIRKRQAIDREETHDNALRDNTLRDNALRDNTLRDNTLRDNALLSKKLREELNENIEKKIKQSGLLEGLSGNLYRSTYETLKKVYYDILIKSDKYRILYGENKDGEN